MKDTENMLSTLLGQTTAGAVKHLLDTRKTQGHWDDIRATSLAVWALKELATVLEKPETCRRCLEVVQDALPWIYELSKREEGGRSWESEGWDTSLAIIALSGSEKHLDRVDQAVAWLKENRTSRGVWYNEIWETTLCAVALINAWKAKKGPRKDLAHDLLRIIEWLIDIPSKKSGEFVSPHYSGFIIWLYAEIVDHGFADSLRSKSEYNRFEELVRGAASWALRQVKTEPLVLWSDDTFSNGYITYALSRSMAHLGLSQSYIPPAILWFKQQKGDHGGFEDTEDTALAILAMAAIARLSMWDLGHYLDPVFASSLEHDGRACIFIGSSSSSEGLKIANKLQELLANYFSVVVWNQGTVFSLGNSTLEALEAAVSKYDDAVFVFTPDDEIHTRGETKRVARDNVLFELGMFIGKLGRRRAYAVYPDKRGIALPSDLLGITEAIYNPDESNLAAALGPVATRIRDSILEKE